MAKASQRKINQVGVVGAGLMGGGIAWWFINNQQFVRLKDISWDMVRKGYQSAASVVKKGFNDANYLKIKRPICWIKSRQPWHMTGFKPWIW